MITQVFTTGSIRTIIEKFDISGISSFKPICQIINIKRESSSYGSSNNNVVNYRIVLSKGVYYIETVTTVMPNHRSVSVVAKITKLFVKLIKLSLPVTM